VAAAPPLCVNGKPDSTNPRKGYIAVEGTLRPKLFVVLAGMQANESHPLASGVLEFQNFRYLTYIKKVAN
jgi:hypothetical protein